MEPAKNGLMLVALLGLGLMLNACSSNPPRKPDDVCGIFDEKRGWLKQARKASRRWGTPVHISMAFIHRESSYVARAKPPRKKLLWVVPWRRPSSAYGYAQATDAAWRDYRKDSRRWSPDRNNFGDAMDFIGWYNHRSHKQLGIAKSDAYHLYLAYYTGPTGYRKGVWKRSATIQGYARKVARQANLYAAQLPLC